MKIEKIFIELFVKFLALVMLIVIIYFPTFNWLYGIYSAPDSYYSHGFLIPGISVFILWLKRERLKNTIISYSRIGLVIFFFALLLQLLSIILEIYFVSSVSLVLIITGLILWLFGRKIFKEVLFSVALLFFMIPIPMSVINNVSFPMRFAATDLVVMTLKVFEFPIQKRGFEILFPRDTLLVDTPCSGIRSLIAFLALGALFAYFLTGSKKMKIFLFLMALPVSFLSNYLRILFLSLIAYVYGAKIATETFLHDFSGVMVFVVGFIFFKFLWGLLSGKI